MSNLDISSATIGVDKAKMATAVDNLKIEVIGAAIDKMDASFNDLENAVRKVWTGASADTYVNNMSADKESVKTALANIEKTLEEYFENIRTRIHRIDQNLVEGRTSLGASTAVGAGVAAGASAGATVTDDGRVGLERSQTMDHSNIGTKDLSDY